MLTRTSTIPTNCRLSKTRSEAELGHCVHSADSLDSRPWCGGELGIGVVQRLPASCE